MKLPLLNESQTLKESLEAFSGYCKTLRNSPSEWYNQKNMSTDFYPAASPRARRSFQSENADNAITEVVSQNEENIYSAFKTLSAAYTSDGLYVLKCVKNAENDIVGACFIKDGESQSYNYEISNKLALFDSDYKKRYTVCNGSNICVFPDGVVFETANNESDIPLFKISAESAYIDDFLISTVYKNEFDEYLDIRNYDGEHFRASTNGIEEYLEDNALWVGKQTYLKISTLSTDNAFNGFNEGDSVEITTTGAPGMLADIGGSLIFKNDDDYTNPSGYKILKKGSETINSYNRDYIIIRGYISYDYSTYHCAYLNSSSFEIRRDLFPKYVVDDSGIKLKRKCPEIAFACESQNRIWGCSDDGHEIYASALGNPYNFYDFSGLSTDSYAVNVGTYGKFTGCINFLGRPLFFKENALHIISGSYPSNAGTIDGGSYTVTTYTDFKGVEKGSERSLAIIDNILYYKSSSGIVAFDGTNTAIISDKLGKEKYKNAVAGAYNNKYYVSMQDGSGIYHMFVYDTSLGTWCKEDNTHALQFININNSLLYIDADSQKLYSVSDEDVLFTDDYEKESNFEWECETGNYGYSYPNNKYLSRFQFRIQLGNGARASFYIQYNSDGIWHRKGEMTGKGIKSYVFPIVPVRCDHMKIKIAGIGDMKLFSISKILEEGGDI